MATVKQGKYIFKYIREKRDKHVDMNRNQTYKPMSKIAVGGNLINKRMSVETKLPAPSMTRIKVENGNGNNFNKALCGTE
jgi:hypothetical protein